jgi:hypothetical protein
MDGWMGVEVAFKSPPHESRILEAAKTLDISQRFVT